MHEHHRWSGLGWNVLPELGRLEAFRDASRHMSPPDAAQRVPHGPAPAAYREAGFDHSILSQIGPAPGGFVEFWQDQLVPALRTAG